MNALKKILVVILLVFVGGCQTFLGLSKDVGDAANAIERTLQPMEENRRQVRLDRAAQLVIENKGNSQGLQKDNQ